MSSSASRTPHSYPNLRKLVRKNILPEELSKISKVVTLYSNLLLEEIQRGENMDLNAVIYGVSPFPGWIDSGASDVWNGATSQLEELDLAEDLGSALQKDGIRFQLI